MPPHEIIAQNMHEWDQHQQKLPLIGRKPAKNPGPV